MLLKERRRFLNVHILHLTFSLVGTVDSNRESTVIPYPTAFSDLLGDLQVSEYDDSVIWWFLLYS